jgi:hypothetical protein
MTTWKLKLTPPDGPVTEKTGLTREQTLAALTGLMYGTYDDFTAPAAPAEQREELVPLAA